MQPQQRSVLIKEKASQLGFFLCGISRAEYMEEEARNLDRWLSQNYHGQMGYMVNHFDKRVDPTLLVPDAKSVISLAFNYYSEKKTIRSGSSQNLNLCLW